MGSSTESIKPPLYPAETTGPYTCLVTGAGGFLAANIVRRLLAAGHTVHGTARDVAKAVELKALPGAAERLKLFAADLTVPGSFDTAAQGCTHVFHVATPFSFSAGHGESAQRLLVDPAVKGTENVLGSAERTATVRRVVLTSSMAAISASPYDHPEGYVRTEADWNTSSSLNDQPYSYAKTLAERRAWELAKAQSRWDLVAVHPPMILGPPMTSRPEGGSIKFMIDIFKNQYALACPVIGMGMADVRDVAAAHLLAAFTPTAHGRNIVAARAVWVRDLVDQVAQLYPGKVRRPWLTAPKAALMLLAPFIGISRDFVRATVGRMSYQSHDKAVKELGLTFLPVEDTLRDMAEALHKLGLIKLR